MNSCVLFQNHAGNATANSINIVFTSKTQNNMPLSSLSQKNCNYKNFLAKDLKGQCIGMNIKQKVRIEILQNEYRYFLKLNFVGANRLFAWVYSNQGNSSKTYKAKRYYLPKGIIKNYGNIFSRGSFCDQTIDSDIKLYKEIIKLTR